MAEEEAKVLKGDRSGLLSIIGKALGADLSRFTIPVQYLEPTSFLQRMMEFVQYYYLLDNADKVSCTDPDIALVYVATFTVTQYASTERAAKSFNPYLGETFEYIIPEKNLKFIAEQVSHHPPIGALRIENDHFVMEQVYDVHSKFLGNTIEVGPAGATVLTLKSSGLKYIFTGVSTTIHNVVIGRVWIDHVGEVIIRQEGSKRMAKMKYPPCGWFSSEGWHDVVGSVFNEAGVPIYKLTGEWHNSMYALKYSDKKTNAKPKKAPVNKKPVAQKGKISQSQQKPNARKTSTNPQSQPPPPQPAETEAPEIKPQTDNIKRSDSVKKLVAIYDEPVLLWKHNKELWPKAPLSHWDLPKFVVEELILCSEESSKLLPPTDSRLRPDSQALAKGDYKLAAKAKSILENEQRQITRQRQQDDIVWKPHYFEKVSLSPTEKHYTYINDSYWKEREIRVRKAKGEIVEENGEKNDTPDLTKVILEKIEIAEKNGLFDKNQNIDELSGSSEKLEGSGGDNDEI